MVWLQASWNWWRARPHIEKSVQEKVSHFSIWQVENGEFLKAILGVTETSFGSICYSCYSPRSELATRVVKTLIRWISWVNKVSRFQIAGKLTGT